MLDTAAQHSFQKRLSTIRTLDKQSLLDPRERTRLTVQDAGLSAFFEYQGQTYVIRDISPYEEMSDDFKTPQGFFIYELTCLCLDTGETVHFEWEYDDALEISMTLERYSFRELTDDRGNALDGDDLDRIAENKDGIIAGNETFWYEDDWAAVYKKDGRRENVYMYEFENEDHTRFLTVEEWSGSSRDTYRIYTSVPVEPGGISLVTKGEPKG